MALVDRGDSRAVTYLGSCMLTTTATGIGALQKPLRDLYFDFRQSGGIPDPTKQRYLTMSSRGMTVSWHDPSKSAPCEVFYSMPNILFWDAVQFVVVKGTKKLCGAFEPLDNDHSRNKDNLFVVLEKKYHFLQQLRHPSLFVCVLRRTTGVKAMDIHVFVCVSDSEALGLVHGLNTIQDSYNENQVSETGAFSYRPFSTAGDSGFGAPLPISRPAPGGGLGPGQHVQHLAAQNAAAAAAAARESQAFPRPPPGLIGRKSPEPGTSQQSNRISLTQNDFQPMARASPERGPLWGQRLPEPDISRIAEEQEHWNEDDDGEVYQYIRHISDRDRPAGVPSRNQGFSAGGYAQANAERAPVVTSPHDRNWNRIPSGGDDRYDLSRSPPKQYESMTRSIELNQDTINTVARKPSNIIARFEERSRATAAVRPQPVVPGKAAPKTAPKPVPSPVDKSPGNLGQGYSFLSGSGSPIADYSDRRYDPEYNAPYPRSRSPGYERGLPEDSSLPRQQLMPSAFYANRDERTTDYSEYHRQQQPRIPERSTPLAADAWTPARNQPPPSRYQNDPRNAPRYQNEPAALTREQRPLPFDRPRSFGDGSQPESAPSRPVAKVSPHKVSGIGVRVLPPNPGLPRDGSDRPTGRVSPLDNRNQFKMPEDYGGQQQPPRRAQSQFPNEPKYQGDDNYGSQNRDSDWKLKPNEKPEAVKKDGKKPEDSDRNMNEKLLQSKKKDAEIASVMQNLRFDYDTSTVSPGVPAGNNFEKSLGYFP